MGYVVNPGKFQQGEEMVISPRAHAGPSMHANMASPSIHPHSSIPPSGAPDFWQGAGLSPLQKTYGHGVGGTGVARAFGGMPMDMMGGQRGMGIGEQGGMPLPDALQAQQLAIAQQLVELQTAGGGVGGHPMQVSLSLALCPAAVRRGLFSAGDGAHAIWHDFIGTATGSYIPNGNRRRSKHDAENVGVGSTALCSTSFRTVSFKLQRAQHTLHTCTHAALQTRR